MKIKDYLKDKAMFLLINCILFTIMCAVLLLINIPINIIFLIFCIWFLPVFSYILVEYIRKNKFYNEITDIMDTLDRKYLLTEIIKEPDFIEGKFVYDLLRQLNKDMHEHVKHYKDMESEYREYIETWVHEIKTPIASARLIIDNNPNDVTKNIGYEIKKVEEYIEQVLYYARSNDVSKDYIIKEVSLRDLVKNVVKRNARSFISKKIAIDMEATEGTVYGDAKWLAFILNQVIGNAIKYIGDKEGKIKIYTVTNENNVVLIVEDNGIGIIARDINRIFEKGFTGENGRKYGKSTGIGLYLCKKLSDQLGIGLDIASEVDAGTKVRIIFPLGKSNLIR